MLIEDEFEDTLLIVQHTAAAALVAVGPSGYELPRVHTAGHHSADVAPIRQAVFDQFGLDAVVLSCRRAEVAGGVVRRLLELEIVGDAASSTRVDWLDRQTVERLASADESERPTSPADGRSWTVPGWWSRTATWLTAQVHAAGPGRVRAIEQIRAWEFSCVLQVRTEHEDLYFKAVPRSYAHEPRLARFLASTHSAVVPEVVATDEHERWVLMRACRGRSLESGAPLTAWEHAAAAYAELQIQSAADSASLLALGCRQRGPLELRNVIGPLLNDEKALLGLVDHGLSVAELTRLRQLRPGLEAACDELAQSGLPLTLEHGDLWDSNIYVDDGGEVKFIDWTDASISHPFFSLMPFLQSAAWDAVLSTVPGSQARLVDRYLDPWTAYASPERLRRALALARPLAALHIAVTYWRDIPQPHTQWWMPRMVPFFVRMALEQWASS